MNNQEQEGQGQEFDMALTSTGTTIGLLDKIKSPKPLWRAQSPQLKLNLSIYR